MIDGRIAGTGRVYRMLSSEIYIGRMAVNRRHRRTGIGGMLLVVLEKKARQLGGLKVILHAQAYVKEFYEKHGYIEEGTPFCEANIEHIKMAKGL